MQDLSEVKGLALSLMRDYGLISDGWSFEFDMHPRRYGVCKYDSKVISISLFLAGANSLEQTEDTIRHEIAHALLGAGYGHSHAWKVVARLVGAKPETYYNESEIQNIKGRWSTTCPKCSKTYYAARLTKRLAGKTNVRLVCSVCRKAGHTIFLPPFTK